MRHTQLITPSPISHYIDETEQSWSNLTQTGNQTKPIIDYYSESLNDFDDWSEQKHMHFGYCQTARQVFKLDAMLDEMSHQVMQRLELNSASNTQVIDLGCGVGASCRFGAKQYSHATFNGVSIVSSQISYAKRLSQTKLKSNAVHFECADYTQLPYSENSFHAAYAIESSCYASGLDKQDFLSEAYRVLKPGSRLVVADGFLKKSSSMGPILQYFHKKTCESWAVDTLGDIDHFTNKMQQLGFKNIQVEDISWKVAPSFAFIPFVVVKFLLKEFIVKKRSFNRVSWGHVLAPLYASVLGLSRNYFSYYLITAEK